MGKAINKLIRAAHRKDICNITLWAAQFNNIFDSWALQTQHFDRLIAMILGRWYYYALELHLTKQTMKRLTEYHQECSISKIKNKNYK